MQEPAHNPVRIGPAVKPVGSPLRVAGPPPLPVPPGPLVGRDEEVAAAIALLTSPAVRLLTLTGPGGVGKTRLALDIARAIDPDPPVATWFVPLASVRDPRRVVPAIATCLGIRESRHLSPMAEITRLLGDSTALLVLDNMEQVIESATDIGSLLSGLPNTKILVTSREPLHISGEHVLPVSCLNTPDALRGLTAAEIAEESAIKLFVARASAAASGFVLDDESATAVAAICRRLDGLPLAIELAATWLRIFPPHEVLRLLGRRLPLLSNGPRDLPERQRTMRSVIDWSHDLIPPFEQAIFRRLAVFDGGIPLQALSVVDPQPRETDANLSPQLLMAVSALVDKNLLQRVDAGDPSPRFSMLEMVREYALERFATDAEMAPIRVSHARWFLEFAERTEARWQTPGSGSISEFSPEFDNIRAALAEFERGGDADSLLRLVAALGSFWLHTGHLREGLDWLGRAIALGHRTGASTDRLSMAFSWRGVLSSAAGNRSAARSWLEQALALRRQSQNREGVAHTLEHLGRLDIASGDLVSAEERIGEAEALFRLQDHDSGHSMVLDTMAEIAFIRRDLDRAAKFSADAVTVARRSGNRIRLALALVGSAQVDVLQGMPDRAMRSLREAVTVAHEVGFRFGIADALSCMASIIGPQSDPAQAVRLLAATTAIRESLDLDHFCHDEQYRRSLAASRDWLDARSYQLAWEQGLGLDLETALAYALREVVEPEGIQTAGNASELSPREREVLTLLVQGLSNPEIAEILSISRKTVAIHVSNILRRLGVESRSAAVAVAMQSNLV